MEEIEADICLLLEGTYPYVPGGVSTWTHELILSQPHRTFYLLCLLPPGLKQRKRYKIPSNVVGQRDIFLQDLPECRCHLSKRKRKELLESLELPLLNLLHKPSLRLLEKLIEILSACSEVNKELLLNSEESWEMLLRIYRSTMGKESFLNFFWSWRSLVSGLFTILLLPYPKARLYHSFCTGYAGLLLARAHLEMNRPCLITEHGIYTNERRIEILGAKWLNDHRSMSLRLDRKRYDRTLKDLWLEMFTCYSTLAYESADRIITLYEGNQKLQINEGADPEKTFVIPNGIDVEKYGQIYRKSGLTPTVAFIGRVVPIKDVKTFIHSIAIVQKNLSALRVYIMGPVDEDSDYFEECKKLVRDEGLDEVIEFTGKVDISDYLGNIDVVVLTSLSEAQPLVILEAGACGIPSVATRVGSCHELIMGGDAEDPNLGQGGIVCPLANPEAIAQAIRSLLIDKELAARCGEVMKKRVNQFYTKQHQSTAYQTLYDELIQDKTVQAGVS